MNGGLNHSILDGWWAEAYNRLNGFDIGAGETHTSKGCTIPVTERGSERCCARKRFPSNTIGTLTACRASGIARMKREISTLGWPFSADRMVMMKYVLTSHIPAAGARVVTTAGFDRGLMSRL